MSGYHSARDRETPLILDCDVVVVGSGAGGAVVAAELAEAGQHVILLEEGPRVTSEEHAKMRPTESLRHVWRDGGVSAALGLGDSPTVNVMMGRVVGGSSMLTGGVCFRIPDAVVDRWSKQLRLADFDAAHMAPIYEHVEKIVSVETVPVAMRSRATELFAEGAHKLGYELSSLRRNTRGCRGCGGCNFGCPHGAKQSVDVSYLPRAIERGADVWSHCLVERIELNGRRAVGVSGRVLNGRHGGRGTTLDVRARRIVLAAGAWHAPAIFERSGLGRISPALGHHLTLHPGFRVMARFDEDVLPWRGALQSAFSDAFEGEGITLTALSIPIGAMAATMPGVGAAHAARAAQAGKIAVFGGILHDEGGGVVRRGLGREPIVTYRMAARDRPRVPRIVRVLADTFAAAGAKELFLPVMGMAPVSPDRLASVPLETIHGRRFECTSQHPLGSCRMATTSEHGVVDAFGRVFDVDELYVADGSVLPTSLGVNPQLGIMAVATRIAWRMRETPLR